MKNFLIVVALTALLPFVAYAQLPDLIVCDGTPADPCDFNSLIELVQTVINALIIVGTMVVPFLLAYSGFLFITRGDDPNKITQGKQVLQNAIIGFAIILSAWLIVSAILAGLSTDPNFTFLDNVSPLDF